ncbi:MAG: PilX N-terminal domain-containing pilus assembly protein [Pseudoxanthomonas sp.]
MQRRRIRPSAASQRGAVLYVAMIMLILLALIGIVGMQVTGLQEKMSANYRNANIAFQNAEARTRLAECGVERQINRTAAGGCAAPTVDLLCDTGFDPTNWAMQRALDDPLASSTLIRSIGKCISGNTSLAMGVKPESEDPNPVFQITAYATDTAANPTADAAVDTVFRP